MLLHCSFIAPTLLFIGSAKVLHIFSNSYKTIKSNFLKLIALKLPFMAPLLSHRVETRLKKKYQNSMLEVSKVVNLSPFCFLKH